MSVHEAWLFRLGHDTWQGSKPTWIWSNEISVLLCYAFCEMGNNIWPNPHPGQLFNINRRHYWLNIALQIIVYFHKTVYRVQGFGMVYESATQNRLCLLVKLRKTTATLYSIVDLYRFYKIFPWPLREYLPDCLKQTCLLMLQPITADGHSNHQQEHDTLQLFPDSFEMPIRKKVQK